MHKYCHDYPHCMCNNSCGATAMLPRNCSSCIWPRQSNQDDWKGCTRCLTDLYKKNFKQQLDTPLWRRAKRARKPPASMMNLHTVKSLQDEKSVHHATTTNQQKRKTSKRKQQKVKRPAEIIIENPNECQGGYLRTLAHTPNCDCQRMRTLLLQQALFNECNCDPYDLLPYVPLTFYPKCVRDESVANFLSYIHSGGQSCLNVKKMLNKEFLAGLNTLYANVGGGKDAAFGFKNYICEPGGEHEFEGFFGSLTTPLPNATRHVRHSKLIKPRGLKSFPDSGTLFTSNHRMTAFHPINDTRLSAESSSQSFRYPTELRTGKHHFKTSPRQILRYLGRLKASKASKKFS